MADISKIKVIDEEYDIKDATVRADLASLSTDTDELEERTTKLETDIKLKVASTRGVMNDTIMCGVYNIGVQLLSQDSMANKDFQDAFKPVAQGGETTTDLLLDAIRKTLSNTGGVYETINTVSNITKTMYDSATDKYYASITKISIPINVFDNNIIFNTIFDIERIPSSVECPIANMDSTNTETYVHNFRTTWTDCNDNLNIFNFKIMSEWNGSNNRNFTYAADGDIQKVLKYSRSNGTPVVEMVYASDNDYDNYSSWYATENISQICSQFVQKSIDSDDFSTKLKKQTGFVKLVDIINNVHQFILKIKFVSSNENVANLVIPFNLTSTDDYIVSEDEQDWVLLSTYVATTSFGFSDRLFNVSLNMECDAKGTHDYYSDGGEVEELIQYENYVSIK